MGQYLEITKVTGPTQASQGQQVQLTVTVRNKATYSFTVFLAITWDGGWASTSEHSIEPGSWDWILPLTMPNKTINGTVRAYFKYQDAAGHWQWWEDDNYPYTITLIAEDPPPDDPTYAGKIESPTVEVAGTHYTAPRLLSYGQQYRLGFVGRNQSTAGVKLWASMRIKRPNGQTAYYGEHLETWSTPAGGTQQFVFPKQAPSYESPGTADSPGVWRADMELRANSASGVLLERKTGVHFFTCEEPPDEPPGEKPDYSGIINPVRVRAYYSWAQWEAAPKTVEQGTEFSINFTVINKSAISLVLRGAFELLWPGGRVQTGSDKTGVAPGETTVAPNGSHNFSWNSVNHVNPFTADEAGDYTVKFRLYGKKFGEPDSAFQELCSPWQGKALTATEAEDPSDPGDPGSPTPGVYQGEIRNLIIRWEDLPGRDLVIPVVGSAPVGESAKIAYTGYNMSDRNLHITSECWIGSPSNPKKYHYGPHTPYRLGGYSPGTGPDFIWPGGDPLSAFKIDEPGEWEIHVILTTEVDGVKYLMAEYDGSLFTAEEAPEGMWGLMSTMMPLMMIMMMFSMMVPMMKDFGAEDKPKIRVVTEPKQLPEGRR